MYHQSFALMVLVLSLSVLVKAEAQQPTEETQVYWTDLATQMQETKELGATLEAETSKLLDSPSKEQKELVARAQRAWLQSARAELGLVINRLPEQQRPTEQLREQKLGMHPKAWRMFRSLPMMSKQELTNYEEDESRLFERLYDAAQDTDMVDIDDSVQDDATDPPQVFDEVLQQDVVFFDHVTSVQSKGRRAVVAHLHSILQEKQRQCASVECSAMNYKLSVYTHPLVQKARITETFHLKDPLADPRTVRAMELYDVVIDPITNQISQLERMARFAVNNKYKESSVLTTTMLRL